MAKKSKWETVTEATAYLKRFRDVTVEHHTIVLKNPVGLRALGAIDFLMKHNFILSKAA